MIVPPSPYYDLHFITNYGIDLKSRKIYLLGAIEEGVIDTTIEAIDYFNNQSYCGEESSKPITILINSPGGHDDWQLLLYDTIINSQAPIHTIGSGAVCSAATLILASGDKRSATESCMLMCHKWRVEISGVDDEVISNAEATQNTAELYWKRMARHTNLSAGEWLKKVKQKGELWLDSRQMLQFGVIDYIIQPSRRVVEPLAVRKLKI